MKPKKTNNETANSVPTPGEYLATGEGADLVNEDDRLQWLAFCYVADELTASQREDFESQLSTDLKAQEALASAVELSSGIYGSYQLQTESANESTLLELAGNRNLSAERSSTLSRMLLTAAAVLVMGLVGYGLVSNSNQNVADNHERQQAADSNFLANDWIDSFDEIDGDQIELVGSEENVLADDLSEDDDLGVDSTLISFYAEAFDSVQEDSLLNSKSLKQKSEMDL